MVLKSVWETILQQEQERRRIFKTIGGSQWLEDAGRCRPATNSPSWDCDHHSKIRPLWSDILQIVCFIKLTVPWEDATEEGNVRKWVQYPEMANDAYQQGWKASVLPVEVGCRGFVATSTVKLLKDLGIHGHTLRQTIRKAADTAEYCSRWLWLRRKDPRWAPRW